jgi:hypothetical protein
MPTELTHAQAAALRTISQEALKAIIRSELIDGVGESHWLSDAGKAAIAAYDAAYAIVRKEDLAIAVRGIECLIDEFECTAMPRSEEKAALARLQEILK